jgi:hypothetical protein
MQPRKIKLKVLDITLVVAFLASAGVTWTIAKWERGAVAGLRVVPGEIDLGEVEQVEGIPFEFQLENLGRTEAVTRDYICPCTCTQLDLAKGASVGPRSKLRVRGTVDTKYRRGAFEVAIPATYKTKSRVLSAKSPWWSASRCSPNPRSRPHGRFWRFGMMRGRRSSSCQGPRARSASWRSSRPDPSAAGKPSALRWVRNALGIPFEVPFGPITRFRSRDPFDRQILGGFHDFGPQRAQVPAPRHSHDFRSPVGWAPPIRKERSNECSVENRGSAARAG